MTTTIRSAAVKVPHVTVLFWVIKVLTTGMGETTADFFDHRYAPVLMVALTAVALAVCLLLQMGRRSYDTVTYWVAVTMVSVFGTMAADAVHVVLGVPYWVSTAFFAAALVTLFVIWHRVERTLSIHDVDTPRREAFYWAAVMTTFALGTAAGDWTAVSLGLGFFGSGAVFLLIFAVPGLMFRMRWLGGVAAFWLSYILTRPLGASFADWMGVSRIRGGLDWGTGWVSLVLAALIAVLVMRARKVERAGVVA